jgi:hypothetical protein
MLFESNSSFNSNDFKGIFISIATTNPSLSLTGVNRMTGKLFVQNNLTINSYTSIIGDSGCFAEGTKIETPRGSVKVENLKVGDEVFVQGVISENAVCKVHPTQVKKIVWTGCYPANTLTNQQAPIRIQKGALGEDVPSEDLFVSPNHGVIVGGALIPAWKLKNGCTIDHDRSRENIMYYHFELDEHSAIVSHGVLTESFLDVGNRGTMTSLPRRPINETE